MAETHAKTILSHGKKSVDIIEFGKELFNPMSVVLMPGRGGSQDIDTSEFDLVTNLAMKEGIVGLAASFKQFQFDPRRRLVITGHTDPGEASDIALEYDLAAKRAEAIYCLLTGKKDRWAALAREKHCIRDYKWILAYYFLSIPEFDCNPDNIDDNWDDKTFAAVKSFFKSVKVRLKLTFDDAKLAEEVKAHAEKLWPEVIWKAVFDLYSDDICMRLGVQKADFAKYRQQTLKFAKKNKEFLGCASSFCLKDPAASGYQKDDYRRVEAMFFYWNEIPGHLNRRPPFVCPTAKNELHKAAKCPIYYDGHFKANYISPNDDLVMIPYHLKFDFFNLLQVTASNSGIRQVPEGLGIQAYCYTGTGATRKKEKIKTFTKFHDGIYTVLVPDDDQRKNIHFEFKSVVMLVPKLQRQWVYTKDKNAAPKLVTVNDDDVKKLNVPEKISERMSYYDLPHEWSSENYWTRYKEGADWKSGRFEVVLKDGLKLKPYGKQEGKVDNPLIFSLDDIVLVDANGKQDIKDLDKNDAAKPLSADSRLALFHVKGTELAMYKPRKDSTDALAAVASASASQIDFKKEKSGATDVFRNVITDVPSFTRGIIFANGFYGIFDKRAGQVAGTFDPQKMHIKGCRAARLKDAEGHCTIPVKYSGALGHNRYSAKGVGNYELHYIHNGCPLNGPDGLKARAFLIVYWNGRFQGSTDATKPHPIVAADVERYEKSGLTNAKIRWDTKGYTLEPHKLDADKKGKTQIKPVYFFEAKKADRGGKHKCSVKITNDSGDGEMGVSTSKMFYQDYQNRNYLNLVPHEYVDYDRKGFKVLVVSHELGHAIGLDDDYSYTDGEHNTTEDGRFGQYYPGMPYQHDQGSMMNTNRAPRIRNLWHFMNRLNDAADDNAELKGLLNGTRYKFVHRFVKGGTRKRFDYHLPETPNDYRDIHKPFKHTAGHNLATGKTDLALYKLGEDETAWTIKIGGNFTNFAFKGIVAVTFKVMFEFKDHHDTSDPNPANHKWYRWTDVTAPDKETWMEGVKSELNKLNNRFHLKNGAANSDFHQTYCFFFPLCLDYDKIKSDHSAADANTTRNKAHYRVEVVYTKSDKAWARGADKTKLKVGNRANKKWIAKYILGTDPGGATATDPGNLGSAEIEFLKTWIRSAAGLNDNTFNISGT